jgi:outer membrane lipoprotein-sorting protein
MLFLSAVLLPAPAPAENAPDVDAIVERMDRLYRSDTSQADVEMEIVTPNWSRTLSLKLWSEGMDMTFMHITSPKKDRGIATLRKKTEMWNYFPKINKVMKVPPSMMMSSWMGSDFTNDDLVKESSMREDYVSDLISPDGADPDVYYVRLVPRRDSPIVWGKIIIAVRKADYIPLSQEYYDENGRKMRVMVLGDVRDLGGRMIPARMTMTPLNKQGHMTEVRYKSLRFDIRLAEDTFTLRNLQKRR